MFKISTVENKAIFLCYVILHMMSSFEKCRWEDNIKMDHRQIGWGGMDWNDLAQDRGQWRALVNMVMNLRVP
jgi:hypothetical protein